MNFDVEIKMAVTFSLTKNNPCCCQVLSSASKPSKLRQDGELL